VALVVIIGPLQRWRPVDPPGDPAEVRTDVLYTLLHRLGLFRLALFFSVEPLFDDLFAALRLAGLTTVHIDQWIAGMADRPLLAFLLYLVVFDFIGYWIHRAQHEF